MLFEVIYVRSTKNERPKEVIVLIIIYEKFN